MVIFIGFMAAVLLILLAVLFAAIGAQLGLELEVDRTKRDGFFKAYGKKYRAVDLPKAPAKPQGET